MTSDDYLASLTDAQREIVMLDQRLHTEYSVATRYPRNSPWQRDIESIRERLTELRHREGMATS